jgi:hypothetical protein
VSLIPFKVFLFRTHTIVPVLLELLETFLEVFWNRSEMVFQVGKNVFSHVRLLPFHHFFESGEEPEDTQWKVGTVG